MTDIIVIGILVIILVLALLYIRKEKKRGIKCIGCPLAGECAKKNSNCDCQTK